MECGKRPPGDVEQPAKEEFSRSIDVVGLKGTQSLLLLASKEV